MKKIDVLKEEALPQEEVGSRNQVNPSPEILARLGTMLRDRFTSIKSMQERSLWEDDKAAAFEAYHLIPRKRELPFDGAANLPCPLPRIAVDSFHANVMSSLYSGGTDMKIGPKIIQKEFTQKAKKAAKYMEYVMNIEANSYETIDDSDKKCHMFGISYVEPRYVKEEIYETVEVTEKKQVPVTDPLTGMTVLKETVNKKKVKQKKTIFDGIKLESIPVESVYFSPFFRTLEEAHKNDVVFKYCEIPYRVLKQKSVSTKEQKAIYSRGQVEKVAASIVQKGKRNDSQLEQSRKDYDGFYFDLAPLEEKIGLVEAYLWTDVDGDDIKESVKVTFDAFSGTVLRVVLSPMRIVEFVPRPVDERLIGENMPKICLPLMDEWENFHNTRSNAGQWEHSFFGFYRAGGRFNPQQFTIKPNHFYAVDDPREVSFPQVQRVGASYFQEENLLLNYFERIFALSENFQGVQSSKSMTATENMNLNTRSSIRFMNPFNRIVTQMNKLLNHIWELNCECAPDEKEFYILGADGAPLFDTMRKEDFASKLQFQLEVKNVFDVQQVRDTALLAYRLFMANPLIMQHPEMMYDLSQKTLDVLDIGIDLPKPPQAEAPSAFEALERLKNGEELEPEVGIDYGHHMKVFDKALEDPSLRDLEPEIIKNIIMYREKLVVLKGMLEGANLNKSGVFPGGGMPGQPGFTQSNNPTQKFNTTRVAETRGSANQNLRNGANDKNLDSMLGAI